MIQLESSPHTSPHISVKTLRLTSKITRVAPVTSHISPWLARLVYPLGRNLVIPSFFGKIEVTGQEYLPTSGPVLLAPTHRSRWDPLLVAMTVQSAVGRYPRFMVTANETTGLQGWLVRHLGGFPIDTARPSVGSLRHGVELLQMGEMLVIFPEGDIFRDGYLHPLKPGLARLAISTELSQPGLGIKIVPIGIRYSHPFVQSGCDVNLHIGLPLQVTNYTAGAMKQQAKNLTEDLEIALKALSGQADAAGA